MLRMNTLPKNVMGWRNYILIKCSILVVRLFSLRFGPFVEKENIRIDTSTVALDQHGKEFSI